MKDFLIEVFIPIVVVVGPLMYAGVFVGEWLKNSIKRKDEQKHKLPEEWWRYAPPWAEYAAMDEGGSWGWFSELPELIDGRWEVLTCAKYVWMQARPADVGNNFKKSLTERPENDKIR